MKYTIELSITAHDDNEIIEISDWIIKILGENESLYLLDNYKVYSEENILLKDSTK